MKKTLLLLAFLTAIYSAANAQVIVSGNITGNTTWTKNNTYLLQGFVYVKNGATLTIEAGTTIKGDKSSKGSLIVTRGAKIVAAGTPSEPIVFTSNEATPTYGDWGGIILLGKAPTNASFNGQSGTGQIEGGVDNAEGDGLYGGTDAADNSGVLQYVRIEYPGIAFQPNSEINGLTLGGVGSATTIDHVQVSYAGDDSFEWFGGTVNCKYLIAYRGLDDDFDADFGYSGKIQFALAIRDPQVADQSGSNGFEIDNDAQGSGNTPKTRPTFSNVTIIGPTGTVAGNYKRANHLRRNSEPGIYNSVFVGQYPVGLFIDGDSCAANAVSGKLVVKNSFFNGMTTPLSTNATNGFDIAAWAASNQVSSSSLSDDAKLVDPFNAAQPNPHPAANSPLINAASFSDTRVADFFFTQVSYAGAFGPSGDWTCPWAKWAQPGCLGASTQEVTVSGNITANTTWTADKTYILQGFVYVKNCATLTIQPGTVIKGDKGSKGALIVTRCSKIIANGTEGEPIVFTTNDPNPTYGSWGGLIVLGNAPTNATFNGQSGVGQIEGGVDNAQGDGLYGGTDAADNSGVLRYVRIEYPGIAFQPNSEINGLTLGGVGSGTTIDHVQVSYSGDDSYEWFGGTVNCKHLIAYRGLDDDFDADFGYSGNVQYALAVRDPQVADQSGSNGFEIDNDAQGSTNTPKTRPTFSNVTIVGPTGTVAGNYKRAAHLRRNSEPGIFNSLLIGNYPVGFFIDGNSCADNATNGLLEIKNTIVAGATDLLNSNASNGFDVDSWYATAAFGNKSLATNDEAKLEDPFNLDEPNAQPKAASPVVGSAAFSAVRVNNAFFDKVTYAGAFSGIGVASDWTCGWARFRDLNTNCFAGHVGVKDIAEYATDIKLYPTVANQEAVLELNLLDNTDLSVELYSLDGRYFGQVINERASAGIQSRTLNLSHLPSGFFFVRIVAGEGETTEKIIVVR